MGLCLGLALGGCGKDKCEGEPASFELAVSIADPVIAAAAQTLVVTVSVEQNTWRRRYPLGSNFTDQNTSLAVALDPAPSGAFQLTVRATLLDAQDRPLADGSTIRNASPNGCNQVQVNLGASPFDGGVRDGGRLDADASDGGLDDLGNNVPDGTAGDAMPMDAAPSDGAFPGDTGTSSTAWFPWVVTSTPSESDCSGPSYVRWNGRYRKWVAAILCTSQTYKLKMSTSPGGPYFSIGDGSGSGDDHCELLDPNYTEPCGACSFGQATNSPGTTEGYFRANPGEDFEHDFQWRTSHYTYLWYGCNVAVP